MPPEICSSGLSKQVGFRDADLSVRHLIYPLAHISSCGSILAATYASGLLLINNLREVIAGSVRLSDASLWVEVGSCPNYLAFEHGKVAISSVCSYRQNAKCIVSCNPLAQWDIHRHPPARRPQT